MIPVSSESAKMIMMPIWESSAIAKPLENTSGSTSITSTVAPQMIQRSECDYLVPVDAEFSSRSELPAEEWERFVAMLRKRGRARITVQSTLHCAGREAVRHSGTFVAMTNESST